MTALLALCKPYLAPVLILAGAVVAIEGARRSVDAERRLCLDPERALGILRGFRIGVIGACLAGAGAGWLWDIGWLLGISLIICGEEVLESSVGIAALRRDPLIRDSPAGAGRRSAHLAGMQRMGSNGPCASGQRQQT